MLTQRLYLDVGTGEVQPLPPSPILDKKNCYILASDVRRRSSDLCSRAILCRSKKAESLRYHRWISLPQNLMDLILDLAEIVGGRQAIASMRLVSKSWRDAIREHPVTPKPLTINTRSDFVKLCDIIPHMTRLEFSSPRWLDLRPLSNQSSLTHLCISGTLYFESNPCGQADLSVLPSNLRSLKLRNIFFLEGSLGDLRKHGSLRSLTLGLRPCLRSVQQELLQNLPNLEVRLCRLAIGLGLDHSQHPSISRPHLGETNSSFLGLKNYE